MPLYQAKPASLTAESLTGKKCYPAAVTMTGTISTSSVTVTGVGTLFLSEIANSANPTELKVRYIYDGANSEVREIDKVVSDTVLILKSAFTATLSGAAFTVPDWRYSLWFFQVWTASAASKIATLPLRVVSLAGAVTYTGGVLTTMIVNTGITFKNEGGLTPIACDGTSNAMQITTQS